jgi:hypothetical protein
MIERVVLARPEGVFSRGMGTGGMIETQRQRTVMSMFVAECPRVLSIRRVWRSPDIAFFATALSGLAPGLRSCRQESFLRADTGSSHP